MSLARTLALIALAALAGCATDEVFIDSARDDEIIVRAGPFASMLDADAVAREGCSGSPIALIDRTTRPQDPDAAYYTYRCVRMPAQLRDLESQPLPEAIRRKP